MNAWAVVAAAMLGLALGWVFFAGLHLTVSRLHQARHPATLVLASLLVRTLIVVAGGALVGRHAGITGLLAMLAAMLWVRTLYLRRTRADSFAVPPALGPEADRSTKP